MNMKIRKPPVRTEELSSKKTEIKISEEKNEANKP